MVELMLRGLRERGWQIIGGPLGQEGPADSGRPALFHVDARFSRDLADVGGLRPGKVFRLLRACGLAVWYRFRFGVRALYYIPAPAKRSAILRDALVLLWLRPLFRGLVLHWHALGLGDWLRGGATEPCFGGWDRMVRRFLGARLRGASLSIALAEDGAREARLLDPVRVEVIPNGIPDPRPPIGGASQVPARVRGTVARVLYFAACTRRKGVFDALDALASLGGRLPDGRRIHWTVAGEFLTDAERAEFDARLGSHVAVGRLGWEQVERVGYLDAEAKRRVFLEQELLIVPSHGESFGLTLLEAMAYGLELATSDLPSFREILGPLGPGRIAGSAAPEGLAQVIIRGLTDPQPDALRARFLEGFTVEGWSERLDQCLRTVPGG